MADGSRRRESRWRRCARCSDSATVDASLLAPGFVYRDINHHVLGTGQSLSVGALGTPVLSLAQPDANITFVTGVLSGGTGLTSFMPLVERPSVPTRRDDLELRSARPAITMTIARDVVLVGSACGADQPRSPRQPARHRRPAVLRLEKGRTTPLRERHGAAEGRSRPRRRRRQVVRRARRHERARRVRSRRVEHRLQEANLLEWQSDYETDVKAVTGQAEHVPMLHSQISSWTRFDNATTSQSRARSSPRTSTRPARSSSSARSTTCRTSPTAFRTADGVHLTTTAIGTWARTTRRSIRRVILEGKAWEPVPPEDRHARRRRRRRDDVRPLRRRSSSTPRSSRIPGNWRLEIGRRRSHDAHRRVGRGDRPRHRRRHALGGADRRASSPSLRVHGRLGALAGPTTGPRGNLRDSDATPSRRRLRAATTGACTSRPPLRRSSVSASAAPPCRGRRTRGRS